MNNELLVPISSFLNHCLQTLQHDIFCTPIVHDERVTYFLSILFNYPFGGGGGVQVMEFLCTIAKENIFVLFCCLLVIIASSFFFTLDEIV